MTLGSMRELGVRGPFYLDHAGDNEVTKSHSTRFSEAEHHIEKQQNETAENN
jgi:hypothetical protein